MDKILIVDDTSKNIQTLATILRKGGYNIAYATNAKTALTKVDQVDFDLIMLDTLMPDIDGFELCKELKSREKTTSIPVLFILPRSNEQNINNAFEVGASDYISKPFNVQEILTRVKSQIIMNKAKVEVNYRTSVKEIFNQILEDPSKLTTEFIDKELQYVFEE